MTEKPTQRPPIPPPPPGLFLPETTKRNIFEVIEDGLAWLRRRIQERLGKLRR